MLLQEKLLLKSVFLFFSPLISVGQLNILGGSWPQLLSPLERGERAWLWSSTWKSSLSWSWPRWSPLERAERDWIQEDLCDLWSVLSVICDLCDFSPWRSPLSWSWPWWLFSALARSWWWSSYFFVRMIVALMIIFITTMTVMMIIFIMIINTLIQLLTFWSNSWNDDHEHDDD